jgi:LysM repeat protein
MFSRFRFRYFFAGGLLILSLMILGSCTRERDSWSADETGALRRQLTLTPTQVTKETSLVASTLTPDSTPASGVAPTIATPVPDGGLPPLPGNETLTPEPPTPTPEPVFVQYKVQPGDSLYTIAAKFEITIGDIKQHNKLENPNNLRVGQELQIVQFEPITPQDEEEGYYHVVKAGETLFKIAQRYSVPLNELAKANNISNPGALRTGQRLLIPDAAAPESSDEGKRVHIVQPGETISEIAIQYGVTPNAIVKANSLSNPSHIVSGQKLIIP